ncbi:hypothetical protein F4811DRAFT_420591 [Daldinia bambusicola]|nr:hypothetical protein F4811DRAFT_420591 [Daldinia bambusicola]
MISDNVAATGAIQNNIGLNLALNNNIHYHTTPQETAISTDKHYGGLLQTQHSYNPQRKVIKEKGVEKLIAELQEFEGTTIKGTIERDVKFTDQMNTLIIRISVRRSRYGLGWILVSVMWRYIIGYVKGRMRALRGKITNLYKGAVNKLQGAKDIIYRLVQDYIMYLFRRLITARGDDLLTFYRSLYFTVLTRRNSYYTGKIRLETWDIRGFNGGW